MYAVFCDFDIYIGFLKDKSQSPLVISLTTIAIFIVVSLSEWLNVATNISMLACVRQTFWMLDFPIRTSAFQVA